MDDGKICAEYNTLGVYRYKARSKAPIPTGDVKIEVELAYEAKKPQAPADIILRANGKEVARGRVERSVPAGFSASETFDIGIDLGSPVALDYHERAPFTFSGRIEKIHFQYT
jgi:arylsulfatase